MTAYRVTRNALRTSLLALAALALTSCAAGIVGAWTGTLVVVSGTPTGSIQVTLNITETGSWSSGGYTFKTLGGTFSATDPAGNQSGNVSGTYAEYQGDTGVALDFDGSTLTYTLAGTLQNNQITGSWSDGTRSGTFTFQR